MVTPFPSTGATRARWTLISLLNSERCSCDLPHVVFVLLRTRRPVQEEAHLDMLNMSLVRVDAERVGPVYQCAIRHFV